MIVWVGVVDSPLGKVDLVTTEVDICNWIERSYGQKVKHLVNLKLEADCPLASIPGLG